MNKLFYLLIIVVAIWLIGQDLSNQQNGYIGKLVKQLVPVLKKDGE
jgi:hypothetical protein